MSEYPKCEDKPCISLLPQQKQGNDKMITIIKGVAVRGEMMGWYKRTNNAKKTEDWLNIIEEFAFTKGHEVVNVSKYEANGINWVVNGEVVMETLADSHTLEFDWFANVVHDFVEKIHERKNAIIMEKKRVKKMKDEEKRKHDNMVNVDSLMTSINNLRTRNSELVSKVGRMKGEIKSANDRIAELEKMLELATMKIAELEDANEELSIYKELVEDETKIEE